MARPTKFNRALVEQILERIAGGESLRAIARDDDIPVTRATIALWIAKNREGFALRYNQACTARAHMWADEILDIADDGTNDYMERELKNGETIQVLNSEHVQRSRLRVDTRKWLLSKMLPAYADKPEVVDPKDEEAKPKDVIINVVDASKPEEKKDDI